MKKVIWILFVVLALIWTALAFAASGLARWTSDAIASERLAATTATVTRSVTKTITDASGQVTERVTQAVTQPVGEAVAGAVQQSIDATKGAVGAAVPAMPALPPLPPMPEWVNQWLGPQWVQSIKEWGVWAKAAAGVGAAQLSDAVGAAAPVANTTPAQASSSATEVVTQTTEAAANRVSTLAAQAGGSVAAVTPWLASIVGWLVPIVWIVWGVGLLLGFVVTLIAQLLLGRIFGSGPHNPTTRATP